MTQYVDHAVTRLAAWIRANLPAQLRLVETAEGLSAGALTDPIEVVEAQVEDDARSPLVMVYDESAIPEPRAGQRHDLYATDCTVVLQHSSDADVVAGAKFARRYLTALIRTVRQDATLGSTVVGALISDLDRLPGFGPQSSTRHVYGVGVEVRTHTP